MKPWIVCQCGALISLLVGVVVVRAAAEPERPAKPRPNIVLIFSDDHAFQAIGCYGSKLNSTPHLDRLAREGLRFDRCLVTNSICGPSRATILTGKYSHRHGFRQNGDVFDGSQVTFPKLLQSAGYETALIGKWHLGSEPTGFDHWMVLPDQGEYYNPRLLVPGGEQQLEGYVTEILTEQAIEWLEKGRDRNKPFLLMLQHKAPHREWMPGPKQLALFPQPNFPEPPTLFDDYSGRAAVLQENQMEIGRHLRLGEDLKLWSPDDSTAASQTFFSRLTADQAQAWRTAYDSTARSYFESPPTGRDRTRWFYQRYLQDYLRCVAAVDESVGLVLDSLERSGLADNTLLVYASDQGFYLGEHGWYDKRWAFEESLRTPLIIRWPAAVPSGGSCQAIVSNLDLAATFLTAAGLPVPGEIQGKSLQPLFSGQVPEDWRKSFYYRYYELGTHRVAAHEAVITDRHKLIHYTARLGAGRKPEAIDQWDLIDRKLDPWEMKSFYDDPGHAAVRAELAAELQRLRQELGAD